MIQLAEPVIRRVRLALVLWPVVSREASRVHPSLRSVQAKSRQYQRKVHKLNSITTVLVVVANDSKAIPILMAEVLGQFAVSAHHAGKAACTLEKLQRTLQLEQIET